MMRTVAVLALLSLATAATISKKDGYGGGGGVQASSYGGHSGGSYDATSYSNADSYGTSNSGAMYYGGSSHGTGSSSYGADASAGSSGSGDSFGNLYYYYYPVTNHSSSTYGGGSNYPSSGSSGYGAGNSGGYGAGNSGGYGSGGYSANAGGASGGNYPPSYYPPPPPHYHNDPFGSLLTSVIGTIDINSLILPALLIGGVALLLPAILNCDLALGTCVIPLPNLNTNGRRRRDLGEITSEQIGITQMIEHAYKIYEAVQEGEQCMQRVVCEVGGMLRNVRGKDTFFSVVDNFVSPALKKQLYVLRKGASQSLDDDSSCEIFSCGKLDAKMDNKVD